MLININDFISGDKFIELADHQYNRLNDYNNVHPVPNYTDPIIIYCHTEFVNRLFEEVKNKPPFILISHNGDGRITDGPNKYDAGIHNIPNNLIHWFGANVRIQHYKITHIPTGLENRCWFPEVNKHQQIYNKNLEKKQYINLCYMNFNIQTNPNERSYIYNLFKNQSWITCDMRSNGCDFQHYIDMIYNHCFILCPEGNTNGHLDSTGASGSHRFWECLYLNSIPIVKRGYQTECFNDLPILLIDNWNKITEQYLIQKLENKNTNYSNKLKMSYWINMIKDKI